LNASGWQFGEIKPPAVQLVADFRFLSDPAMVIRNGEKWHYDTNFTARRTYSTGVRIMALAVSLPLVAARDSFSP
jgi:hypothetical protein